MRFALAAEREGDAVEQSRVDGREHVRLVLGRVVAARDQPQPVALDDPRVVARPEHVGTGAARELDERVEAEAAVAAHARVRRQALRVALDERLHDGGAELLAEVERDVRQAERDGTSRGPRSRRRASSRRARRSGRPGSSQSRSVTPIAFGAARRSATALSTPPLIATAMRPGRGAAREHGRDRVRERVGGERLAGHRGCLEQRQPDEERSRPGASASTMPVALDDQPHGCIVLAAGGVADQLEPRHAVRLAGGLAVGSSRGSRAQARPGSVSHWICAWPAKGPHQVHMQPTDTTPQLRQSGVRQ